MSALRDALEHAERNCDNAVHAVQRCLDISAEDIMRTTYALRAVCEALRPIVERLEVLGTLAERLRVRAAKDEELATTKLTKPDSFMYVLGRAQTLKAVAEELDALEGSGASERVYRFVGGCARCGAEVCDGGCGGTPW